MAFADGTALAVTRVRVTFAAGAPTGHVMETEFDRAASTARPTPP